MKLHEIAPAAGARRKRKRVGRGPGSGLGKTAARGHKGQRSRSGYSRRWDFEGGQMPLVRRLPKRGFHNPFRIEYRTINVESLNGFAGGSVVSPEALVEAGLVRRGELPIKILGHGELSVKLTVRAHRFTAQAAQKIEAAGGTAERLEG